VSAWSVPSGYGQIVMSEWLIEFKRLYPGIVLDVLFENRVDNLRDDVDIIVRVIRGAVPGGAAAWARCATWPVPRVNMRRPTACPEPCMHCAPAR
jgi:DNA-binding transcriptional LysR family regulator